MIEAGRVFSIAAENPPIPGCTVSGELMRGVTCFSLAAGYQRGEPPGPGFAGQPQRKHGAGV